MSVDNPYISVVVTARNDNHGGNLRRRMQIFVSGILQQAARHRLPLELVLVEWNPPADKPSLKDELDWSKLNPFVKARIITVPRERHARFEHGDRLPLYQMIAKNVGIRRAAAPFILATNVDLLFADELFAYLAEGSLCEGRLYRTDRYDVDEDLPEDAALDEQLEYCRRNLVRLNHPRGSINLATGEYHRHHADDIELVREAETLPLLHTNACGDFQLMAKSHWFDIRGYPEWDMFSFHLDSVTQFAAHCAGAKEYRLGEPFRVYHVEHKSGWTPEVGKSGEFEKTLSLRKIRKLTDEELRALCEEIVARPEPTRFNEPNWGMIDEDLPETVLECAP